jgi:hypothetical protein
VHTSIVAPNPHLHMDVAGTEDYMSPFDEGVVAAETGMSKDDNPYRPGTDAHSDWNAGYEASVEANEANKLDDE